MYVNAFWLGVLCTLVLEVVAAIILALVKSHDGDREDVSTEEYKKLLEDMTGRKFRVKVVNGYLVGEPIENTDDEEGN